MEINKIKKAVSMPVQDPVVRVNNFDEVALGYTDEMAREEATRCINCTNAPCMKGCPVGVKIPLFIQQIRENNLKKAFELLSEENSLPAICGRVCPQESQCQKYCVRGKNGESVAIGRLERYVADWHLKQNEANNYTKPKKQKVAIIGSGPSGLACAGVLAKNGYQVKIFEALHMPGGVLSYGIPAFRLPKEIVRKEIEQIEKMGVSIETDIVVGRTKTIEDLFSENYEAVYIGSGAGLPNFMGIPGESLCGVCSANEYLSRVNLLKAGASNSKTPIIKAEKIIVVGGGNVAMDAARVARRMGSEVTVVYRRSLSELPARQEEVEHAKEEGINFKLLSNPVEILGDEQGFVKAVRCDTMVLGEPDASGRRSPVIKPDSQFTLECDMVIMAIGTRPNPLISMTCSGLETNKKGCIVVEENQTKTTLLGVYAGGDAVTGAATVILAMGAGRKAAGEIMEYLQNNK